MLGACLDEPEPAAIPEPIGPELYRVYLNNCSGCTTTILHRDQTSADVELRAIDEHGAFVGRVIGTLSDAKLDELEVWLDGIRDGTIELGAAPQDVPFDGVFVKLSIASLGLT
jgi:hypothetical protein